MEKHYGLLGRVGGLSGGDLVLPTDSQGNTRLVGAYRSASELDSLTIGSTVLKKPMCEGVLFESLFPGRTGCLYVWRNGRRPVLVGIKYDDGEKFLVTKTYLRGSILQLLTVISFMYGLGGLVAGGIAGGIMGLETTAPVLAGLCGAAAVGYCWWKAWDFWQAYQEARRD